MSEEHASVAAQSPHTGPMLPPRSAAAHKGSCGTVVVVAGCSEPLSFMPGAAVLAARGALRSGAGLVRVVCPAAVAPLVLSALPSATVCAYPTDSSGHASANDAVQAFDKACEGASSIVVGCGLGRSEHARALVYRSLSFVGSDLPGRGAIALSDAPVVIDADGLRLLAEMRVSASELRRPVVLTPHPGEFVVIAESLHVEYLLSDTNDDARTRAADAVALKLGCIVVLKGHRTVVTNGLDPWICNAGHPCMATAGTGDVLAGSLGGVLAQRVEHTRRVASPSGGLSTSELDALRTLARAKLGKLAEHAAPSPTTSDASLPSLLDCVKLGVLAHARGGEAWADKARAAAGMLAAELADELPAQLAMLTASNAAAPGSQPRPSSQSRQ